MSRSKPSRRKTTKQAAAGVRSRKLRLGDYTLARDAMRVLPGEPQSQRNAIWCGDCRDVLRNRHTDSYSDSRTRRPN